MKLRRPTRLTTTFCASTALGLALGAAILVTSVPARAEEDVPLDTKIFRGIMESLGLKRDGEGINYQERGPLVIPPRLDLPPPETTSGAAAKNPSWPKDPDVIKRKTIADMDRNRNVSDEREREQNPLRPDQMTPGGKPPNPGRNREEASTATPGDRLSPDQLGSRGNIFTNMFSSKNDEVAKFTGERPRAALTEPPAGYQTPSPEQPYGLGQAAPAKPVDIYTTRSEPQR
jgi:hypothetical protein